MTFDAWLAANGYDAEALKKPENSKQRAHLEAAWKAETAPPPVPAPPTPAASPPVPVVDGGYEAEVEAARRESERQDQIRSITLEAVRAAVGDREKVETLKRLGDAALADRKCEVRDFRLDMHRQVNSLGPMILTPKPHQLTSLVVEAAVCKAGGLKTLEKDFDAQTLDQAHRQFRSGIGLLEMVGICAQQNGWHGRSVKSDLRSALRAAFSGEHRSEMSAGVSISTIDIGGLLSNVANKFVREAFMFVEQVWRQIAAIRTVTDFKEIATYSLTGDLTYEKVAPTGELKHGTLGAEVYGNKAETYGKILGISRTDLINDDAGALNSASRRLGRGGALKLNDVFWTEFLDNATFFTAARGNYDDGAADTLMDLTGLANAHTLFTTMTDPDGQPVASRPAILLTPPQLYPAAWTLTMSPELNLATGAAAATGTRSPWTGMFRLLQSLYLAAAKYAGASATAWYMLADPADVPVIEVAFLNGAELPTIETADLDFDRLGIALRGYHDFGARRQEYRAGVKMKGAA